jgi:Papain-like cysteine protease AvrRpt2
MSSFTVPFSSQYTDIGHHEWRARGCGIASLHMVLAYWHVLNSAHTLPSLDTLLERGRAIGAYREGIGWTHTGLVNLACQFGYNGFNADFAPQSPTPKSAEDAWSALGTELKQGPVMASVYAGLDAARGGGHIVVVTGFQDGLVHFNDPEEMTEREGRRVLALDAFLPAFKRRYIVVRPSSPRQDR